MPLLPPQIRHWTKPYNLMNSNRSKKPLTCLLLLLAMIILFSVESKKIECSELKPLLLFSFN